MNNKGFSVKNVALITSTIAPQSNAFALKHNDPNRRLEDYIKSLIFYIEVLKKGTFDKVIYIDNSGFDLSKLEDMVDEHGVKSSFEFISYTSNIDPQDKNRLFLELNLIKYGIENSSFIQNNNDINIWKITGRYIVKNIEKIVEGTSNITDDLIINHRNYPYKVLDLYLVRFNPHVCESFLFPNIDLFDSKEDGEVTLRNIMDTDPPANISIVKRFPCVPLLNGTRGFDGAEYGQGKDLVKYYVRSIMDRLLPFFWL